VDAFCAHLVEESTVGYVAADGVPPYLRCVLAGGNRVHRQNVGALNSTGEVDPTDPGEISLKLLASMLGEQPADDGHRGTILDPTATHLGVSDGTVRVSHEFGA
jgi:hypothetical protein